MHSDEELELLVADMLGPQALIDTQEQPERVNKLVFAKLVDKQVLVVG